MATIRRGFVFLLVLLGLLTDAASSRAQTGSRDIRPPTRWDRDWAAILVVLGVTIAQSALIGLLLVERRKRIRAQRSVEAQTAYEQMLAALRTHAVQYFPDESPRALEFAIAQIGRYSGAASAGLVVHPEHSDEPPEVFRWTRGEGSPPAAPGEITDKTPVLELPLVLENVLVGTLTLRDPTIDCRGPSLTRERLQIAARLIAVALARARAGRALSESRGHVAHLGRIAVMGQLSAVMSHELRQPLTAIRYNAKAGALLLERQPLDLREVRAVFQEIITEIAGATELMEHVRMMLRHQEGARVAVSINDVCRDAVRLLQRDAHAKDVTVDVALMDGLPPVHGDAVQLQQVVLNSALNAIESAAASERERRVVLCTTERSAAVELEVHDSGAGLPPQVHQHLFQSYFSTKRSGLGMGLVIVHQIVEGHNGQVHAENAPGGGAVFRVMLPREASKSTSIAESPTSRRPYENDARAFVAPARR